jgi:predicted nucleic acid-binding protein
MAKTTEALVVDASVVAKWYLRDETDVAQADLLLSRFTTGELVLVAPEQIRYEIPATISVATLGARPRMTQDDGRVAIETFLALGIPTFGTDDLILSAFSLVHQHRVAFYDALYLALATILEIPFITADNRLYQRIASLAGVIWISDYQAAGGAAGGHQTTPD